MQKNNTDTIVSLFFSINRVLKQKLDLTSPLFHLSVAQIETLRFIGETSKSQMKEVADFLAITPPSATTLVNHLVKMSYVQRQADKKDRRTVHLSLTKKGQQALVDGIEKRCQVYKKLLQKLNKKQQEQLLLILNKMIN